MGKRREGREAAVQFLFQNDLNSSGENAGALEDFWNLRPTPGKTRDFSVELIRGVLAHRAAIDEQIKKYVANYELDRIAAVDRNILRVGIYEMLFCRDVPPIVSINEAIEIAKRFGGEESGRFVNGVLDRLRHNLARPARTAG
jgi:N utilization substance protein B